MIQSSTEAPLSDAIQPRDAGVLIALISSPDIKQLQGHGEECVWSAAVIKWELVWTWPPRRQNTAECCIIMK